MHSVVVPIRECTPRAKSSLLGIASTALIFLAVCAPVRADEWVQVARDGLGDPTRVQVDALAVLGEHVYIGVHQSRTGGDVAILRSAMRDDHRWSDDTPPWEVEEVAALEILGSVLYAATTDGQLWRRGRGVGWSSVSLPGPGTPDIYHVTGWNPLDGSGLRLCVLRAGPLVSCRRSDGTWTDLPPVPLDDPDSVATGKLVGYDGVLIAGFGGDVGGSRRCEVWRYTEALGWDAITTDGFDEWAEGTGGLTWIRDLEVFDGHVYMGTGGHTAALLIRLGPRGVEDATPHDLYSCSGFGSCPVRYNALAATPSQIYAGTRTGGGGSLPLADILVTDDGLTWRPSNDPGFGVDLNDTITAMGSRDVQVYAGLINGEGFQVWRRNVPMVELIPSLYRDLFEARIAAIAVLGCLLPFQPCAPPWDELRAPIDEIQLGLGLARHSQDDPAQAKDAIAAMYDVGDLFEDAKTRISQMEQTSFWRPRWGQRLGAFRLVVDGYVLADRTVRSIGAPQER